MQCSTVHVYSIGHKPVRRVGAAGSVCTQCDRRWQLPFCQRLALRMPSLSTAFPTYSGDNTTPRQTTGSHGLANRAVPGGRPVDPACVRVAEILKFDQRRVRHRVAVGTRQFGIPFKPCRRLAEAFEFGAISRTVIRGHLRASQRGYRDTHQVEQWHERRAQFHRAMPGSVVRLRVYVYWWSGVPLTDSLYRYRNTGVPSDGIGTNTNTGTGCRRACTVYDIAAVLYWTCGGRGAGVATRS